MQSNSIFQIFFLAFDINIDISDTPKFIIFICKSNGSFKIITEILKFISVKVITKGKVFSMQLKFFYAKTT